MCDPGNGVPFGFRSQWFLIATIQAAAMPCSCTASQQIFTDIQTKGNGGIAPTAQRSRSDSGGFTSWASWTPAKNEKYETQPGVTEVLCSHILSKPRKLYVFKAQHYHSIN